MTQVISCRNPKPNHQLQLPQREAAKQLGLGLPSKGTTTEKYAAHQTENTSLLFISTGCGSICPATLGKLITTS
jgi:hypothetical protein